MKKQVADVVIVKLPASETSDNFAALLVTHDTRPVRVEDEHFGYNVKMRLKLEGPYNSIDELKEQQAEAIKECKADPYLLALITTSHSFFDYKARASCA